MQSHRYPADLKVLEFGKTHELDRMVYRPLVAELKSGFGFKGGVEINGHCQDWIKDGYLLEFAEQEFTSREAAMSAANAMLIERLNILDVSPKRLKLHLIQGTQVILAPVGPRIDMSALEIATVTSVKPALAVCIGFDEDADEYPPEYNFTQDGRLDSENMAHLRIVGIATTPGTRAHLEATFREHHDHLQRLQRPAVTFVSHDQMFGLAHNHSIVMIDGKSYVLKAHDGQFIAEGQPQDLRFDEGLRPVGHGHHIEAIALVQGRSMTPSQLDTAYREHSRINGIWAEPIINTDLHALYNAAAGTELSLINAVGQVFRAHVIDAEVPMEGAPAIRVKDHNGDLLNTRISTSTGLVDGVDGLVFGGLHHVTDHSILSTHAFELAGQYLQDDEDTVRYRQEMLGVLAQMGTDYMGRVPITNFDNEPASLQVSLRRSCLVLSNFPHTGQECHYDFYQQGTADVLRRLSSPQIEPLLAHLDAFLAPSYVASSKSSSVRLGM